MGGSAAVGEAPWTVREALGYLRAPGIAVSPEGLVVAKEKLGTVASLARGRVNCAVVFVVFVPVTAGTNLRPQVIRSHKSLVAGLTLALKRFSRI